MTEFRDDRTTGDFPNLDGSVRGAGCDKSASREKTPPPDGTSAKALCPVKVVRQLPLATSHSFTVLSLEAEITRRPSGVIAARRKRRWCGLRVFFAGMQLVDGRYDWR